MILHLPSFFIPLDDNSTRNRNSPGVFRDQPPDCRHPHQAGVRVLAARSDVLAVPQYLARLHFQALQPARSVKSVDVLALYQGEWTSAVAEADLPSQITLGDLHPFRPARIALLPRPVVGRQQHSVAVDHVSDGHVVADARKRHPPTHLAGTRLQTDGVLRREVHQLPPFAGSSLRLTSLRLFLFAALPVYSHSDNEPATSRRASCTTAPVAAADSHPPD